MQIMAVFLVQQSFVRELKVATRPNLPNVLLIDIAASEIDGVRSLLQQQSMVQGSPELLPIVSSRILAIDGVPAAQLKLQHLPRRMLQSTLLTWSDGLPPGTTVINGSFWKAGSTVPQVAIDKDRAERIGAHIGSHIVFAAQDAQIDATVTAIVQSDGRRVYGRVDFILPPAVLKGLPVVWYGGAHVDPAQVGDLQRVLYARYPTVTVINLAQGMETLRNVLLQVSLVVQFLAGFSIFAGLVILASAIAGTRYRRIREVVVLKTLGATRARIATVFSIEFATLGVVSGVVGLGFANLVARVLLTRFTLAYHFEWLENVLALVLIALLTVVTGWMASHRILGQKPLEVLREE